MSTFVVRSGFTNYLAETLILYCFDKSLYNTTGIEQTTISGVKIWIAEREAGFPLFLILYRLQAFQMGFKYIFPQIKTRV